MLQQETMLYKAEEKYRKYLSLYNEKCNVVKRSQSQVKYYKNRMETVKKTYEDDTEVDHDDYPEDSENNVN